MSSSANGALGVAVSGGDTGTNAQQAVTTGQMVCLHVFYTSYVCAKKKASWTPHVPSVCPHACSLQPFFRSEPNS